MNNPDLFARRPVTSVDIFTSPPSPQLQRGAEQEDGAMMSQNPRPPMPHWRGVAGPHGSQR